MEIVFGFGLNDFLYQIVRFPDSHDIFVYVRVYIRISDFHSFLLISPDTHWFVDFFDSTWFHLISTDFTWFHLISPDFSWFLLISTDFSWFLLISMISMISVISVDFSWFLLDFIRSVRDFRKWFTPRSRHCLLRFRPLSLTLSRHPFIAE